LPREVKISLLVVLWSVPLLILSFAIYGNWKTAWSGFGAPGIAGHFQDVEVITSAVQTYHQGGDPLVENPADFWHRPMNYPRVWVYLFSFLHIDTAKSALVGCIFAALYLLSVSAIIVRSHHALDGILLLIAALSAAPFLAIQVGNSDLLIFSLVFLGCVTSFATLRSSALFAAAALKLYPLAALAMEAIRRPKRQRLVPLLLTAALILLFAWQWRDLMLIRHSTPISSTMSYGVISLKAEVDEDWAGTIAKGIPAGWIFAAVCWMAGGLAAVTTWAGDFELDDAVNESASAQLFSTFAAIYAFSFVIGSNWDYRLIYLVPTLPFALELARNPPHRKLGAAYVGLVLLAENAFRIPDGSLLIPNLDGITLSHLATFGIFLIVTIVLTAQCKWRLLQDWPQLAISLPRIWNPAPSAKALDKI
jgi:hypothetical protein